MCQKSQFWKFWNSQVESPETKWHFNAAPVTNHREYYKGEGGCFPQVRVIMSLVNLCMHVIRSYTKSALIMH